MPALSDNSRANYNPNERTFYPFKAVYRVSVGHDGRRWTVIRTLEKIANFVEADLINAGWNIATPVRFVPQFGMKPARIEITGFTSYVSFRDVPNTNAVNRMSTGVVQGENTDVTTGQPGGGNLSLGQEPTPRVENDVTGMIITLEADSTILGGSTAYEVELEYMEYNGIKYGRDGRTFPTTIVK